MYTTVLILHSWIRWIALIAAVGATFAAVRGQVQGERSLADRWGLIAMMTLDIQMLLGLLLYLAVSPNMQEIRAHFGEAMKNPQLRFWAVEHVAAMPAAKRKRLIVCFGLATVLVLVGMPWPGTPAGRPLFRLQ